VIDHQTHIQEQVTVRRFHIQRLIDCGAQQRREERPHSSEGPVRYAIVKTSKESEGERSGHSLVSGEKVGEEANRTFHEGALTGGDGLEESEKLVEEWEFGEK
jgi:hypothetical protein